MELRLGTGYKQILFMAMPITLAMLVPQINFITNNIFLGMLGEQELASAGITGVYYLIFAVIGNGLNNGLQALIARRAGQNLPKEIGRVFYNGVCGWHWSLRLWALAQPIFLHPWCDARFYSWCDGCRACLQIFY